MADLRAREYIIRARELVTDGVSQDLKEAFKLFVMAFEDNPHIKPSLESEFLELLAKLNELYIAYNLDKNVLDNFNLAIKAFPYNKHLLNDMGKSLYKHAFYNEALYHFHKALRLDSTFVNPEKNINSIKNLLVERWHYRMLNDKIRNEAYRAAIHETIIPNDDTVLDIGTGTGLLAMYALESGPKSVTGCDGSEVMTALADDITKVNNFMEIVIINKMSTSITFEDMRGKRSVVLTEMFDAGLFGEHVLRILSHAWDNFLNEAGRVIPNKAEFFVAGVKCDHLNHKYQLCSSTKKLLNIPTLNVHLLTNDETYDCEDVHLIKDINYITEPQSLLKVNFNDYRNLKAKLKRTKPYSVKLKVKESGEINSVIGWFNLYLTDNVTITTDPRSDRRANAWQQAVFFDNLPKPVTKGETVKIDFLLNGGKLTMLPDSNYIVNRISAEAIRFLNDTDYIKMISGCIGMACVHLGQMADMAQICVADLCPFPVFGLKMMKNGAQHLVCCAHTEIDRRFIKKVLKRNRIPQSKVNILVGDSWTESAFGDDKYHAIICNVFEGCGDMDLRYRHIARHLRISHLVQGGLFMPANVKTVCQLVYSHWLDINNRLYDENVSNFKISMYLNKYEVTQNFCIDFAHLEYTAISDPVVIGTWANERRHKVVNVPIVNDGCPNAILCWYSIELMDNLNELSTNRSNSFIEGMLFLINPKEPMTRGQRVRVGRCMDPDGSFKLRMEGEAT